jgi:hypothetical protein
MTFQIFTNIRTDYLAKGSSAAWDHGAKIETTKLSRESHILGTEEQAAKLLWPSTRQNSLTSAEEEQKRVESSVREKDVLFGRTKVAHAHPGNVTFRRQVRKFSSDYQDTRVRAEKAKIVRTIMACVLSAGGRFLKSVDNEGKSWCEPDEDQTYDKVSHALRSATTIKSSNKPIKKTPGGVLHSMPAQTKVDEKTYGELLERQKSIFSLLKESHKEHQEQKCNEGSYRSLTGSREHESEVDSYDEDIARYFRDFL